MLAGLTAAGLYEAHDLFGRALRELGRPAMREGEVGAALAKEYLRRIIDGRFHPHAGARRLWELELDYERYADFPRHLSDFVGLAHEWEDYPDMREQIEAEIREAAQASLVRLD